MGLSIAYILPLILGRTFDYRDDRVGIDIFPPDQLALQEVVVAQKSESSYKMITKSADVENVLDVSGEIALKVKAGLVNIQGSGNYLKNSGLQDKTVEVLTRMTFSTYTYYLPFTAKPTPEWTTHKPENLGTHYVHSITYGGELIASLKFVAHKEEDVEDIKGKVEVGIKSKKIKKLVVKGELEKLKKDLHEKANMEITYYATVPLNGVPNTLEGLQMLVETFGDHVKKVNNGTGNPIKVELMELSTIDTKFSSLHIKSFASRLITFNAQFDDLRKVKVRMTEWIKSLPPSLTKAQEEQISKLYERINKVRRSFYDTIGKLDGLKEKEWLDSSVKVYREGGSGMPGKFTREYEKMKRRMIIKDFTSFDVGRSTYVKWGSDNCNKTTSNQIFTGYMATSSAGIGGGTEFLCLPQSPSLGETLEVSRDSNSLVDGVIYGFSSSGIFDEIEEDIFDYGIVCSLCYIANRSSVVTQVASLKCFDGWITEYKGYIVSTKDTGRRTSYICLDKHPGYYNSSNPGSTKHDSLKLVGMTNEDDEENTNNVIIPCVVCSK